MPEFPLQFATRQIRRAFERAIGRNIPKILTELITNADDSYRRLVDAARRGEHEPKIEDPAPITILFARAQRRFAVMDRAEGLTDAEMREQFVTYGQESPDRSRGYRTRGLFGKGLRDVLFTQHHGQVKSIKDGYFYNSRFRWKEIEGQERPVVDIRAPSRVTSDLRKALELPANGTVVEFQLAEGVSNPQHDKLLQKLGRFYMLRMINSSPHREVNLKTVDRRGNVVSEAQVSYRFPEMEIADQFEEDLRTHDGDLIHVRGLIGLCDRELTQGEVGYEDREGGLLVLDEDDTVLDLWLFGFDEDPNARRVLGTLHLIGAGAYIRRKLNQRQPEEVLTETREGLDKNHSFYRLLRDYIQPRLARTVASLREQGPQPKSRLSEHTRQRHQQAFEILNRLYSEMLGKTGRVPTIPARLRVPPPDGIAFLNSHVSIQAGVWTPVPLLVNAAMVHPSDTISFHSDQSEIEVSPAVVSVGQAGPEPAALIKMIRIRSPIAGISGRIAASWKTVKVGLDVTTTERDIMTPVNGLEFEREEYDVRLGSQRHLRLYIDTDKIPLGSRIDVAAEGDAVKVVSRIVVLSESQLVTTRVGEVDIEVNGVELTKQTLVSAGHGVYVAGTKVSVVKRSKPERGRGGVFREYRFAPLERRVQSLFVPEGFILINTKDPVNTRYFGSEPYQAVEEHAHCQVRLADLVLNECLQMMVSEALESGKLDRRFPNNPEIDIRHYVDEKKFEIGPEVHKLFVTRV